MAKRASGPERGLGVIDSAPSFAALPADYDGDVTVETDEPRRKPLQLAFD